MVDKSVALKASLGTFASDVNAAFEELKRDYVLARLWEKDHTVWKPRPTEITNRLGWLESPKEMLGRLDEINTFVEDVKQAGFTQALLLGMGGSSMAPEVFSFVFGKQAGFLDLAVLDSTDPGAVLAKAASLDYSKTLFIVSTKSGGTVETFSFFKYFYNQTLEKVGKDYVGQHFVAITDPESGLQKVAEKLNFRKIFLNDPDIGGRFSALSYFGIVPAALLGIDIEDVLKRTQAMAKQCRSKEGNSGFWLGVVMGELARKKHDKVTLIASDKLKPFGAWAEQLVAESAGKEGRGILPVTTEPVGKPEHYAKDRLFIYLKLADDTKYDSQVQALVDAGHPVVQIAVKDIYDIGAEFFRWEIATAIACRQIGVNPFDQPNVESAKVLAREMVAAYKEKGELPTPAPIFQEDGMSVFADSGKVTLQSLLNDFLSNIVETPKRTYLALHAYVIPNAKTDAALESLATKIRDSKQIATTIGYGPRFLHSTGQLHKGDEGHGLFIQFTSKAKEDVDIPDEAGEQTSSMSFNVLKTAQALGDRQALVDAKRRVVTIDLGDHVVENIQKITGLIS